MLFKESNNLIFKLLYNNKRYNKEKKSEFYDPYNIK